MELKQYVMHTDNGHGWLAVKRDELAELGLFNRDFNLFIPTWKDRLLEEDSDLQKFLLAKYESEDDFQKALQKFFSMIRYSHHNTSPVRSYEDFTNE